MPVCVCARKRLLGFEAFEQEGRNFREVAGAGTKGRYDQRLPSVSFALGLNVCLIELRMV